MDTIELQTIPEKIALLNNPTENLLNGVRLLYDTFNDKSMMYAHVIVLIAFIATGLTEDAMENGEIKPAIDKLLTNYMYKNSDFLTKKTNQLISYVSKN